MNDIRYFNIKTMQASRFKMKRVVVTGGAAL